MKTQTQFLTEIRYRLMKFGEMQTIVSISTCDTPDHGWETALKLPGKSIEIVEHYGNESRAISGHLKWCMDYMTQ